jgi:hypothetical protein
MNHPSMTWRGRRIAFFLAIAAAIAIPKRIPCRFPGEDCEQIVKDKQLCSQFETEPFGVYLIEYVIGRDVGIRYSEELDCR